LLAAAALVPMAALLCSCSSSLFSQLPTSVGGLPADAPERPVTPTAYPSVFDTPPPREDAVLTSSQQQQVQDDLMAARDQQARRAGVAAKTSP